MSCSISKHMRRGESRLLELNEAINTLNKNDKVMIVYGENAELFKGYVDSVSENHLIIHEYVMDNYRTLNKRNIKEISKV